MHEIRFTVFNVTSLTSGDVTKHLPGQTYPVSIPREPSIAVAQPFSNISQTFSFTLQINPMSRQNAADDIRTFGTFKLNWNVKK